MSEMEAIIGLTEGKQPVIVVPKEKLTLGVNRTAKAAVVYNYLEDDVPVSKLSSVHATELAAEQAAKIMEAVEQIEQLEDEADSYADIGWKDVDKYLMGSAEGDNAKRIETYMSIENRLLEARNALNIICHRIFSGKLVELGIIEEREERPEEAGHCSEC